VAPERVLMNPIPGTATEADLVRCVDGDNKRLVELIDGTLVEKTMGAFEGRLGMLVAYYIESFLETNDLGMTFGAHSPFRVLPRQVRLPDVSFVPWSKLPNRKIPRDPIAPLIPDLAVEVLSVSNTRREMQRKRKDYFAAGVKRVWQIDPDTQTAKIYTAPEQFMEIDINGALDGADVLMGFTLPLKKYSIVPVSGKTNNKSPCVIPTAGPTNCGHSHSHATIWGTPRGACLCKPAARPSCALVRSKLLCRPFSSGQAKAGSRPSTACCPAALRAARPATRVAKLMADLSKFNGSLAGA
jgi:Uma2 family endonuclease